MLTSISHTVALLCLWTSSALGLILVYRFVLQALPPGVKRPLAGLFLALLITPVYPSSDATTLAPALIVAVLNAAFLDGWASAQHAVWILLGACAGGLAIGSLSLLISPIQSSPPGTQDTTSEPDSSSVES